MLGGVTVCCTKPSPQRGSPRRIQMPSDIQWIAARIAEARKKHDSVTDAVSVRMEKLLSSELSEQPLSTTELKKIAELLLADMLPASSDTEAKE